MQKKQSKIAKSIFKKANHMHSTLAGHDARVGSNHEGRKATTIMIKVSYLRGVSIGLPNSKGRLFYEKTHGAF